MRVMVWPTLATLPWASHRCRVQKPAVLSPLSFDCLFILCVSVWRLLRLGLASMLVKLKRFFFIPRVSTICSSSLILTCGCKTCVSWLVMDLLEFSANCEHALSALSRRLPLAPFFSAFSAPPRSPAHVCPAPCAFSFLLRCGGLSGHCAAAAVLLLAIALMHTLAFWVRCPNPLSTLFLPGSQRFCASSAILRYFALVRRHAEKTASVTALKASRPSCLPSPRAGYRNT